MIDNARLVIYDALGRIVFHADLLSGSNMIYSPQINHLAEAMYLVCLEGADKEVIYQSKMIIVR